VSGLETLPPDQRAVLQLILVQGRGYRDLAAMLKLDAAAVRERARAGADALGLPDAGDVDAQTRAQVVDYLLGQQDDGERIVTFATLGESPAACRWAHALRERLASVAHDELPEVPSPSGARSTNGSSAPSGAPALAAATPVAAAPASPQPTVATPAPAAAIAPTAAAPAPSATPAAPPPPAAPGGGSGASGPTGPRPSLLGGAILIVGAAALAIVLAIVLIGGNDNSHPPTSTSGARTPTQSSTSAQTSTTGSRAPTARLVGQANLTPTPAGGSALGVGLVERATNGRRAIAIEATRLPANGARDIYAVWLQGSAGAKFLGFVPRQVGANGTFTVTAPFPTNAAGYSTVLITREGTTAVPTTPGTTILSGTLRLTG